jgi:hypothetical protein
VARITMGGQPGKVRAIARDTEGPGGASLLTEDSLELQLRCGAAAKLAVEGLPTLECGLRGAIARVGVRATDAYGNHAAATTCEVLRRRAGRWHLQRRLGSP